MPYQSGSRRDWVEVSVPGLARPAPLRAALKGRKRDVMELGTSRPVLSHKERCCYGDPLELDDPHSCHACARARLEHDGWERVLARYCVDLRWKCSRTL